MQFPLAIITAITVSLFVIVGIIQAARKNIRVGCWGQILLFLAVVSATLGLSFANIDSTNLAVPTLITASTLALLIISSTVLFLLERVQSDFRRIMSRGLLGLTTGGILFVIFFAIPLVPQYIFPSPVPTPIVDALQDGTPTVEATPSTAVAQVVLDEPIIEPSITFTALPSETVTRTRRAFVPPTETPTPPAETVADECDALVSVNLNLRSEPNTDSDVIAVVPEDTFVSIEAKNPDGTWWQATYQGEIGWLAADFIELDPICLVE